MDKYTMEELANRLGVDNEIIVEYVHRKWLAPEKPENHEFDEEDLARAQLIADLIHDMGVNDEAVSIILHLVDQIHCLKFEIRRRVESKD